MSAGTQVSVDDLEVVAGFEHENLQGAVFEPATFDDLRDCIEKAFDYRGDVMLHLKDGETLEGYIFDRKAGATPEQSSVGLFPKGESRKVRVAWSDIAGIAFTGRDTAAGKSWEAWLKKYWEKKAAGEKNIELKPETLD